MRLLLLRNRRPTGENDSPMKLSVVIPCYNERQTIEALVKAVSAAPVEELEIIVVDDGSTDGTREFLRAKPQGWVDRIVLQKRNFGKGAALRAGFQATMADPAFLSDARKRSLPVQPRSGDDVRQVVDALIATPSGVIATLKHSIEDAKLDAKAK